MAKPAASKVPSSGTKASDASDQQQPPPITKVPLKEAPPPWHSVALIGAFLAFCVATLPSLNSIDEAATLKTFTSRVFPQYLSLKQLGYIRLVLALSVWWTSFHTVFLGNGWTQTIGYLPSSKLIQAPIRMYGWNTMFPMTSWTWNLLGLSFSVNAYISLRAAYDPEWATNTISISSNPWLFRSALVLFEIAAPTTCLVAFVVRYAIWPRLLVVTGDSSALRHPRNIMMHNANAVYSLVEALLLGGIPVRSSDFGVAPLFGIAYVTFLWSMIHQWVDAKYGPQVIYFFLDPTLGWGTTKALAVLMVVLIVCYALFASIHGVLELVGWNGNLVGHVAAVVLISSGICRVRD